jgi:4-carboxymuconolactone decarboxylase
METKTELFDVGLELRREVLGPDYVDGSIERSSSFMQTFQHITTEWCWGFAWTRPGLSRKERSLINIAMLTALNRPNEVRLHVRGALNNGVTVEQIREVLVQATVYCGIPAGLDSFKIADEVLKEAGLVAEGKSGGNGQE